MKSILAGFLLIAAAAMHAPAEAAMAVPNQVDLATVLRLAREASPRIELERQGIAQALADRITAGAYPNPTITYGHARPSGAPTVIDGSRQQDATLELPLLIAGQRAARVERAERAIEAARARVAAGASNFAAEAGAAFVALLAAQEKTGLLAAANAEIVRARDIVSGREASGAASRYDVARLDVELGGLRAKLEDARADVAERSGSLSVLLGLPGWRPVATGTLATAYAAPSTALDAAQSAAVSPIAIAAAREQATAESAVEVARRERWPVPAVSLGRTWSSDPFGAGTRLGLTVEIPILDSHKGQIARAEADASAALLKRNLVTAELAANIRKLQDVIAARRVAIEGFEKDAASRLPALRQMAEDAYRLGRGSILELLDATRSRYELQQIRIDLAAALIDAQVRLAALTGGTP